MDFPPFNPDLHSSEVHIDTVCTSEYWREICPHLHVSDEAFQRRSAELQQQVVSRMSDERKEALHKRFAVTGFFNIDKSDIGVDVKPLAVGVERLMEYGWPPTFIYMYDDAWQVVDIASELLKQVTGGSKFIGDLYSWHVDPRKNQTGWGPHRDRMGSDAKSFREDGTPMLSTSWMALTDAHPENSCLYVVPAEHDEDYRVGDAPGVDTLAKVFADPVAYQYIRALPCEAGSLWHFGHRIIHWGSAARSEAAPRIAMSWIVGDDRFEEPAFPRSHLPYPEISMRVSFVSAQIISYGGQTNLSMGLRKFYFRMYKRNSEHFNPVYHDKVMYLFYCRPPPNPKASLRESTKRKEKSDKPLEFYTEEDDALLDGMKSTLFGSDSSSSDEE